MDLLEHSRSSRTLPYFLVDLCAFAFDPERDDPAWVSDHMFSRLVALPVMLCDPFRVTEIPQYPANCVGNVTGSYLDDDNVTVRVIARLISQPLIDFLKDADIEGFAVSSDLDFLPREVGSNQLEPPPRHLNWIRLKITPKH